MKSIKGTITWLKPTSPGGILVSLLSAFSILTVSSIAVANIAQGFVTTDSDLTVGMAAAYSDEGQKSAVIRMNKNNSDKFVGIVTTENSNLVTLKNGQSNVIITTNGNAVAYISDLNGEVNNGDYLVASPLEGVLVKATASDTYVLATALEDFSTTNANSTSVSSAEGTAVSTQISTVKVDVNPQTIAEKQPNTLSFLQVIGGGIIGRTVSNWQVASVLIIFLMILVVEGSLMYGAVHGTIIALGRNPLAHEAVYRQLLQAVLTVVMVFVFGLAIIYVVLQI